MFFIGKLDKTLISRLRPYSARLYFSELILNWTSLNFFWIICWTYS